MTKKNAELYEQALGLPEDARADLAARLLDSLDTANENDVDVAWDKEILRRLAELDSGQEQPIPWSKARSLIQGQGNDTSNC